MTNPTNPIDADAVVRRLYARGNWKLESVAHFGGDETGAADMCLLRDADGQPFIQGASITGAARSFLARQSQSWMTYKDGKENQDLKDFFGGADQNDTMSTLIVADAHCVCEQARTFIRDGVRVDTKSGSAADKAKFDVEVVERDTEFELALECIIREADNSDTIESLFLALLHALQQGEIRLGARTRRGYGRGKVASWEIHDLQMSDSEDVIAWLRDAPESRPKSSLPIASLTTDQRQYFRIEADFNLRTSLLIRSSSEDPAAPDMVHLHSNGEPVVPGTSFAGAFRHRATLIANSIGWTQASVDKMFGPVHEQQNVGQQGDLWASRVWVEEQLVKNVESQWQDRVAIDRFTGGSLQSALFNEKPVYPLPITELEKRKSTSHLRLILTLDEPKDAEIGLLLLTLRDFWHGHAALGGETSNGRGTFKGVKAKLWRKQSTTNEMEIGNFSCVNDQMTFKKGDEAEKDHQAYLKKCVEESCDYQGSTDDSNDLTNEERN